VELKKPFELDSIRYIYSNAPGIILQDDPANNVYPLARTAENTDEVYVGRLRRDFSVDNGLNLWVVADNIRKGAASNAVQIAFELIKRGLI
jgi:aspartate-semialdehyde dehydrogenase